MATTCKGDERNSPLVKQQRGFTLLEVLVSITILSIGLLAMGSAETISVTNSVIGRDVSVATAASEEILERMRRNRPNILSYDGFDTNVSATRPVSAGTLQNDYDQWKVDVERVPGACASVSVTGDSPLVFISTAEVTVMWPPCDGSGRQLTVQTLFQ